jgi:hypothetical protein
MYKTLFSVAVAAGIMAGCGSIDKPVAVNAGSTGNFSCKVDMTTALSEVVRLDGVLFKTTWVVDSFTTDTAVVLDSMNFNFSIQGTYALAYVNNIDPGYYTARINAYDRTNKMIYTGATGITVESGQTAYATVRLGPANGNISFTVTWNTDTVHIDTGYHKPDCIPVSYDSVHFGLEDTISTRHSWQQTGIVCFTGDSLYLSSSGFWTSKNLPRQKIGPDGDSLLSASPIDPLPGAPKYAIIGKIGINGKPFLVGSWLSDTVSEQGALYLTINQYAGNNDSLLTSNNGNVAVSIGVARMGINKKK